MWIKFIAKAYRALKEESDRTNKSIAAIVNRIICDHYGI